MAADDASGEPAQILIAGGGFAAVEAALALRALAGDRVALAILAPDPMFHYRPAVTTEPFDVSPSRRYDLRALANDLGADYHESRLEARPAQALCPHGHGRPSPVCEIDPGHWSPRRDRRRMKRFRRTASWTLVRGDDEDAAETAKGLGRYLVPYLETRDVLSERRKHSSR